MATNSSCEVYAFDPTYVSAQTVFNYRNLPSNLHFIPYGLCELRPRESNSVVLLFLNVDLLSHRFR